MSDIKTVTDLIARQQALRPEAVARWAKATNLSLMELVQIGTDLRSNKIDSGDFVIAVVWDEPIRDWEYYE